LENARINLKAAVSQQYAELVLLDKEWINAMSQKMKLGVIGSGNIFRSAHAKTWKEHPEIEISAICDINRERAEKIAQDLGVSRVYTNYEDLLKEEDIDLVDICTPNLYHSIISIEALHRGKHVFCEKPDAVNPVEAQKMADAAQASGNVLMVMRNNRFQPAAQFLKQYIEEGSMGDIYTGRCGWIRRRGIPGQGGWFTTKELSGGGPLIDLGVHFIDLTVWLMGNPKPVTVSGSTYCKFAGTTLSDSANSSFGEKSAGGTFDVEDLATGFIRFDNGATLQIEFSWASNVKGEENFVELRGTKSGIRLVNGELEVYSETAGKLTDTKPILGKVESIHGEHIKHFVDVVKGRVKPINTPEHGVDMIKILSALYESAKLGKEIQL
jgi:predicted dehydrogenase